MNLILMNSFNDTLKHFLTYLTYYLLINTLTYDCPKDRNHEEE